MRPAIILLPLLVLSACATPRERCLNDANREVRVLNGLINETRGNLARGYAIERGQDVRTVRSTCVGRNEDGTEFRFRCDQTETVDTRRPVAINLDDEQAKLATLEQRQAQNRANAATASAQCRAIHPE